MQQTACLVINPVMVNRYAALFSSMAVVHVSDSMTASIYGFIANLQYFPLAPFAMSISSLMRL